MCMLGSVSDLFTPYSPASRMNVDSLRKALRDFILNKLKSR